MSERKMPQAVKTATELGPILVFFAAYYFADLFVATGAIMVTTLIALAVSYHFERKIAAMPLVTAVVVTVFGGLTLYLQDETFIKIKPTVIYVFFAGTLGGGLLFGKSFVKFLFGNIWDLDDTGWKKLTVRLTIFFFALAILNEVVWRNFSEEFWVNFKVFGFTVITFVFFIAQVPLLTKHGVGDKQEENG